MANYTATNGSSASAGTQQAMTTAYVGALLGLTSCGTTPRRSKVFDVLIGTNGSPTDGVVEWEISRVSAASTATYITPQPLDFADAASGLFVSVNSSTFGTISVQDVWYVGVNSRASYRWVAAPGSEIVSPATSSAGVQLRNRATAYTGTTTGSWMWNE